MNRQLLSVYVGPVLVTLAYLVVYYAMLANGLRTKKRLGHEYRQRGERFDRYFGQDPIMLASDRYILNMLEQMPPFLCLLWLHAVFVSPLSATVAGSIYVASRVAYPLLMGPSLAAGLPTRVLLSTFTGYAVLGYFGATLSWAAAPFL